MMRSKVSSDATKAEKPFPKLMKNTDTGLIVAFVRHGFGIVVHPGSQDYELLHFNEWDMSLFQNFYGSVTLTED